MTGSGSEDNVPNEIPYPRSVGPQIVEVTECGLASIPSSSLVDVESGHVPVETPSQIPHLAQQESSPQHRTSYSWQSLVGHQGDSEAAATTAAMSVASLEETPKSIQRIERENFLLFIKILFKVLEEDNDPPARTRAQRIVMECRRRNQQGDPNFTPLMVGVERHLRTFVGEAKWRRSHLLLHHYVVTRRGIPGASSITNRERPTAIMVGK